MDILVFENKFKKGNSPDLIIYISDNGKLIRKGALWQKVSKKGKMFFSGNIELGNDQIEQKDEQQEIQYPYEKSDEDKNNMLNEIPF